MNCAHWQRVSAISCRFRAEYINTQSEVISLLHIDDERCKMCSISSFLLLLLLFLVGHFHSQSFNFYSSFLFLPWVISNGMDIMYQHTHTELRTSQFFTTPDNKQTSQSAFRQITHSLINHFVFIMCLSFFYQFSMANANITSPLLFEVKIVDEALGFFHFQCLSLGTLAFFAPLQYYIHFYIIPFRGFFCVECTFSSRPRMESMFYKNMTSIYKGHTYKYVNNNIYEQRYE